MKVPVLLTLFYVICFVFVNPTVSHAQAYEVEVEIVLPGSLGTSVPEPEPEIILPGELGPVAQPPVVHKQPVQTVPVPSAPIATPKPPPAPAVPVSKPAVTDTPKSVLPSITTPDTRPWYTRWIDKGNSWFKRTLGGKTDSSPPAAPANKTERPKVKEQTQESAVQKTETEEMVSPPFYKTMANETVKIIIGSVIMILLVIVGVVLGFFIALLFIGWLITKIGRMVMDSVSDASDNVQIFFLTVLLSLCALWHLFFDLYKDRPFFDWHKWDTGVLAFSKRIVTRLGELHEEMGRITRGIVWLFVSYLNLSKLYKDSMSAAPTSASPPDLPAD